MIITRKKYRIAKLAGKQTISPVVAAYLKEVKAKHAAHAEARKLYQLLLDLVPEAQTKEQLIIVRDGPLHLVPFDALVDIHHHYVVESQTVVYAPSATSFFLLRTAPRPKRADQSLLAVGGVPYEKSGLKQSAVTRGFNDTGLSDLPSSEDEARAAVDALPNRMNTLLVGNNATETAFKKATNHGMMHLAVHAIANEARPDRAALVLLSDPAEWRRRFPANFRNRATTFECRPDCLVGLRYGRRTNRRTRRNYDPFSSLSVSRCSHCGIDPLVH